MHDDELDELRARVDCRAVLENAGWELDAAESTAHAAKYRGGPAQIVIVTHSGKGWFDPLNDARGDVLALAQHLWGGTLGHARKALRPLAGISPEMRPSHREKAPPAPLDAAKAWRRAHRVAPGSQGWAYMMGRRGLPVATIERALGADLLREGIYGTVWALHRDSAGKPCGWEMRGPQYKGFAKGGDKALFWIGELSSAQRIAVTESWIDALSLATLETWPNSTAYVSTGGGFGPRTADAMRQLLPRTARLVAATDQGRGGELLADRLHDLAATACAGFGRLRPIAKDWNAQLTGR
ncbi:MULTISPECIES: DUF3991 and TOPRIM domain-containing protein [Hyphomicrobiales]|jgi:hypothetical protein|uniref:DUF3991 domain-containing protein n=1 Tax=Methylorubrum populi TaxID=223967 RepID=A0A160PPV1_9HYPH|nr:MULTISPECIES: DUF3991 and TOPRIM domain-containing protein [Hyphomicrobiales]MDH0699704.1 DUF3991 and toprim domain-containing protein [Agrobacterium sp. GD03871]MDH1062552.1 DUF3991 and toprim domain-containing protein [Agrobacterium sp. GD03992]MDH2228043.1 DUF3991 and toprim domain-containing protein [Agrobacterium sp. GD03642]BAU94210.1 hypothetical protein MPPM_5605 [Methylorubrum populi]